jgi:hypothetical protein
MSLRAKRLPHTRISVTIFGPPFCYKEPLAEKRETWMKKRFNCQNNPSDLIPAFQSSAISGVFQIYFPCCSMN